MRGSKADYKGSNLVFLLEITWGSYIYRFSTYPIEISKDDGSTLSFHGGLSDPDLRFSMPDIGFSVDSLGVPFSLIFPQIDISQEMIDGNLIDYAKGELSYVLERSNSILETYEKRIKIFSGVVSSPVYGHPDQPLGYVEFSLESENFDTSLLDSAIGTSARVNEIDISPENEDNNPMTAITTDGIISIADVHRGKVLPVIIGQPSQIITQTGNSVTIGATPAYMVGYKNISGANIPAWFVVAGHLIDATTITLKDNKGGSVTGSVVSFNRSDLLRFSFIEYNMATGGLTGAYEDPSVEYYASFTNGGGIFSTSEKGTLRGGGDLCIYILSLSNSAVDFSSWNSIRKYLNRYKFDGVINNPEITPLEFLQKEILPLLPIGVIIGPNGLKPVLHQLSEGIDLVVVDEIEAGSAFYRNSPVTTLSDPDSIINEISISFGWDGIIKGYRSSVRGTYKKKKPFPFEFEDQYSQLSFSRFGRRAKAISSKFIYDLESATRIVRDIIRFSSFPYRLIEYSADSQFGFLELGDIIHLTDQNISIEGIKAQIVSKRYVSNRWIIGLRIENNPVINRIKA